jgi:hypothetical protein
MPMFSLDEALAGWLAEGVASVRHPHAAPDAPALRKWNAAHLQHAVGWLATVQARAEAGHPVTPKLDLRIRAAGFTLERDDTGRCRATHPEGLITSWADDLPTLHGWLLATAQRPTLHLSEASHEPTAP